MKIKFETILKESKTIYLDLENAGAEVIKTHICSITTTYNTKFTKIGCGLISNCVKQTIVKMPINNKRKIKRVRYIVSLEKQNVASSA